MSHKFQIYHKLLIYRIALTNFTTGVTERLHINHLSKCHKKPPLAAVMFSLLFQPKILAAIDYIRNVHKQRPDAEAIYRYSSRTEASDVNKTDIVNTVNSR